MEKTKRQQTLSSYMQHGWCLIRNRNRLCFASTCVNLRLLGGVCIAHLFFLVVFYVLFLFVVRLVHHISTLSALSILDCPFGFPPSLHCPFSIAPSVFHPLCIVHSRLPLWFQKTFICSINCGLSLLFTLWVNNFNDQTNV